MRRIVQRKSVSIKVDQDFWGLLERERTKLKNNFGIDITTPKLTKIVAQNLRGGLVFNEINKKKR